MRRDQYRMRGSPPQRLPREPHATALLGKRLFCGTCHQQRHPVHRRDHVARHRPVLVAHRAGTRRNVGPSVRPGVGLTVGEGKMRQFFWGLLAMASLVASLFFLRYWKVSSERLFAFFGVAFGMLAL